MSAASVTPFFSVLIPCYNRPEYVSQAVASVLANTETDSELIVSDNCSPRRPEIIQALAPYVSDPRLTFVLQPENLGEARNRHFLMQRACGVYRIILADDDLLAPHALATLRATIARQPGFDLYLFGYTVVDEDGRVFETRHALAPIELSLAQSRTVQELFCSDVFPYWFFHPATFCFPASLHADIVPNHTIGIGDDLIFIFDALLAGKRGFVIPEALFSYRKFMGPRTYSQPNLSQGRYANIITRRHIFYHLLGRDQLPAPFGEFIRSRAFRERFLYNAIITDRHATMESLEQLDLQPEHLREARNYWQARPKSWFGQWLQLQRLFRYVGYFGFRGLVESAKVFRQRRAYRQSIARL